MKQVVHVLVVAGFLLGYNLQAQGDAKPSSEVFGTAPLEAVQDQRVIDSLALWEEKVYLHTDRNKVIPGEALFFKAYVYNGPTQRRFSPSGVLRLELRNAENALVTTQYHRIQEGAGEGLLRFPKKLEEGKYQLIAHTRWMKNYGEDQFFRKTILVGGNAEKLEYEELNSDPEFSFFPEGGRLLAGIPNRMIVRSSGGRATKVRGSLLNESGKVLMPVQSYAEGYGLVIFQPEAGQTYRFRTMEGMVMDLPQVEVRGYSLNVNNLDSKKISLEVQPAPGMGQDPVILKGQRDGKTHFIHMLEFDETGLATLEISKSSLPLGFMDLTLTGLDETLWAKRPVWIGNSGNLQIEIEPLSWDFSQGSTSEFKIRVTDPDGNPVQTNLSLAVSVPSKSRATGIDTFLKPFVFETTESDGRRLRFLQDLKAQSTNDRITESQIPGEIRFPVEQSLELHGTAYDFENKLLTNTEIQMLATSDTNLVIREMITDASGVLHVTDLNVVGDTQFVFRTKGDEQTQRLVKIVPLKQEIKTLDSEKGGADKTKIYKKTQKKKNFVESTTPVPFDTTGVIVLKEATIEKRREQQKVVPSLYDLQPNPRDVAYQDPERPMPIQILAQNIPGIQTRVTPEGLPVISHMRRGGGGILWVVDGQVIRTGGNQVVVGEMVMSGDDPFLSPLTFLAPSDILRMEFYIDIAQTAMFGVIAPTGVMIIYTRSGNFMDYVNRKEGGLLFKGYEPSLEFDAYLTERQKDRKLRKTPPATLYWNPNLQTDSKGEAVVRFKSPADYSQVQISVEGLTEEGLAGSYQDEF